MNQEGRSHSLDRKKQKKRKRSQEDKKKKKQRDHRDNSNENKKKDKEKKKHKSKSKDRHRQQRKDKQKQRQIDYQKQKEYEIPKQKQRYKQKERERQKQYRQKNRDQNDRDRQRQRQKYRDRERERSRDRQKKRDRSRSKKKDYRSRSSSRKQKNDRYKGNNDGNRDKVRQDKYERWRKQAHIRDFRFDSPPKSDESDMSDDPEKMDKLNKMKAEKQLVTSKADKKLYLGNLPPNITSTQLMQMLNSALKKMEINCESDGDSIVSAWISPDGVGHYAFVQFRTAQQATAGLALNGASLYGYQLKLGRPKQYIQYHKQLLSEFGSDGNIDTILRKVQAMGGFINPPLIEQRLVYPPSKVLVLKHIVTIQELAIDQQYTEILEDVTEMAKRHGDVLNILIPRPMEIDLEEVKTRVKGLGYIFIRYKTVEQAKYARKQFIKCMFSQRSVTCSYFPQKKFLQGDLDVIDKIIIDF